MKSLLIFSSLLTLAFLSHCSSTDKAPYIVDGYPLPDSCQQVIVSIPETWDSSSTTLQVFEKENNQWKPVAKPIPARLGSSGLVWGLGVNPVPNCPKVKIKTEGDKRTPAGIFKLDSTVYAYDEQAPVHPSLTVSKVTPYDLWVEDPQSPLYNKHLVLDHLPSNDWEKNQQMKQNDPSHALKWFILHNAPNTVSGRPIAGAGSSIFFHIWRDNGNRATAGCTSMSEANLKSLLQRIDMKKNPMYVILPKQEYDTWKLRWNLP